MLLYTCSFVTICMLLDLSVELSVVALWQAVMVCASVCVC